MNRRENNINIFDDTKRMCQDNGHLAEAINDSIRRQYVIAEQDHLEAGQSQMVECESHRFSEKARVIVSKKRSLEAASAYVGNGDRVCVHNFASATNPGGGVERGSNAQEEALCRCSTLYFCISDHKVKNQFHDLHRSRLRAGQLDATYNDDCIYTPGVVVFKTDTDSPKIMKEQEWYEVNVISCAAPNLRVHSGNATNPGVRMEYVKIKDSELLNLHRKRMSRILEVAKSEKQDVVILGAFGCGAFCNSPTVVAEAMARVVGQYRYDFKVIEFAVYCPPADTKNFDVFYRRLG